MQLQILDSNAESIRAGYDCPCGCRPRVTYERNASPIHEGCCCGNEFALGTHAGETLKAKAGFRAESTTFAAPWGETIDAAWLIGPSVHDDEGDHHPHEHRADAEHNHHGSAEGEASTLGLVADPVCGMRVQPGAAEAKGLHGAYGGRDFYFCGRGCKLDFDEDPERYLDASYVPTM